MQLQTARIASHRIGRIRAEEATREASPFDRFSWGERTARPANLNSESLRRVASPKLQCCTCTLGSCARVSNTSHKSRVSAGLWHYLKERYSHSHSHSYVWEFEGSSEGSGSEAQRVRGGHVGSVKHLPKRMSAPNGTAGPLISSPLSPTEAN